MSLKLINNSVPENFMVDMRSFKIPLKIVSIIFFFLTISSLGE